MPTTTTTPRTRTKNPPRDKYDPPTGFALGEKVKVALLPYRSPYRIVSGRILEVAGFGNPEINPEPSVRLRVPARRSDKFYLTPSFPTVLLSKLRRSTQKPKSVSIQ